MSVGAAVDACYAHALQRADALDLAVVMGGGAGEGYVSARSQVEADLGPFAVRPADDVPEETDVVALAAWVSKANRVIGE